MSNCKYCHDKLEKWNTTEPSPLYDRIKANHFKLCYFCMFDIDDDDKILAKMEYNHNNGAPNQSLERQYQRYLGNG